MIRVLNVISSLNNLEYNAVENTRAFCTQLLAREEQHAER